YKGFDQTYSDYSVEFDEFFYESKFYKQGKEIVSRGLKDGIFVEKDNAIVAPLEKFGLPDKVLVRSDSTTLYVTQDLFMAVDNFAKLGIKKRIYVVGSEQILYFQQLFRVLELLGYDWAKDLYHFSYGMVYLPEGKMKSREGKVVDADDLLNDMLVLAKLELMKRNSFSDKELEEKLQEFDKKVGAGNVSVQEKNSVLEEKKKNLLVHGRLGKDEIESRAKTIALAAIKFYMLRVDSAKDMHFNPAESISFEGETGPYLLYTYARAKSILRKSEEIKAIAKYSSLDKPTEQNLIALLSEYPQILKNSLTSMSLHVLCRYLISLSAGFNSFYNSVQVLSEQDQGILKARLELIQSVSIVLQNGAKILGINVLEEM
ncbi:MAG: arginine--tRNA ligase, partial [Candidatus Diapherotrites archaeon]|nr:arginine--tRNA ligase [Candidatus Diapherotrites archaeon]